MKRFLTSSSNKLLIQQLKHLQDQINSKEREYKIEIQKVISERDLKKQRVIELQKQRLRFQISNLNQELHQQFFILKQLNKQIKDYEIQQNQSRESKLENNKQQQLRWDRLLKLKCKYQIEAQNQEIKSYTARLEEQLTTITELKYKVYEEQVEELKKSRLTIKFNKQVNSKSIIKAIDNHRICKINTMIQKRDMMLNSTVCDLSQINKLNTALYNNDKWNKIKDKLFRKQLLDYNEIADQHQNKKKELQSLTDLLDSKLSTIVSYETKRLIQQINQRNQINNQDLWKIKVMIIKVDMNWLTRVRYLQRKRQRDKFDGSQQNRIAGINLFSLEENQNLRERTLPFLKYLIIKRVRYLITIAQH
ncbi:unnamed protein product (macronuclear) [Paramecium tetraurelia]|uniref:Uncharacterized protein n=1 Tax=Paramecium tetraurelia TaxID=5888 RepID=A0CVU3_PARTE|nr:uncharacterized protein GSPATT00001112001 [Paramecium tetraurelia]CAK74910.1 unnamed protein product [Paramecium tetraurelia]|eukprot:XP_001442307.1 hypothetical protein (macronuclear) [Paramecium tetraurelia strain d4-2]